MTPTTSIRLGLVIGVCVSMAAPADAGRVRAGLPMVQQGGGSSRAQVRPAFPGESTEDWVLLGTKLHGGFGSYVAFGVYIGLDAREQLGAEPRTLEIAVQHGPAAPCPCIADGLQLATGATVGRGLLRVVANPAPDDTFAIVTVTARPSGRTLRYTVPAGVRERLDRWNALPAAERLPALRTVPADVLFVREEVSR